MYRIDVHLTREEEDAGMYERMVIPRISGNIFVDYRCEHLPIIVDNTCHIIDPSTGRSITTATPKPQNVTTVPASGLNCGRGALAEGLVFRGSGRIRAQALVLKDCTAERLKIDNLHGDSEVFLVSSDVKHLSFFGCKGIVWVDRNTIAQTPVVKNGRIILADLDLHQSLESHHRLLSTALRSFGTSRIAALGEV